MKRMKEVSDEEYLEHRNMTTHCLRDNAARSKVNPVMTSNVIQQEGRQELENNDTDNQQRNFVNEQDMDRGQDQRQSLDDEDNDCYETIEGGTEEGTEETVRQTRSKHRQTHWGKE